MYASDLNLSTKDQEEILYYSPELKRMIVSRQFKRPQKLLKQENGICPRCYKVSVITTHNPKNRPYMDIKRSLCEKGHLEIVVQRRIDEEKSRSRF